MSLLGLRNKQGRTASASCLWRVACNLGLFLSPCCSWTPGHPSHIPSSKPPSSHSPFVRCPSFSPASRGAQEGSLPCSARGSLEPGKARLVASMSTSSSRHHHLFDAHCHIQLGSTADEVDELIGGGRGSEGGNLSFGVMSTRPHDWPMVSSLCARHPGRAVAAYGLHPWWAHYAGDESISPSLAPPPMNIHPLTSSLGCSRTPSPWHLITLARRCSSAEGEDAWLADLRERVVVDATAIVGEIGLDKKWTAPPGWRTKDVGGDRVGAAVEGEEQVGDGWVYDTQVRAFQAQVRLATELGRPVSMHCVAAHGDVFEFLRGERELPPAMYMHSFGGKVIGSPLSRTFLLFASFLRVFFIDLLPVRLFMHYVCACSDAQVVDARGNMPPVGEHLCLSHTHYPSPHADRHGSKPDQDEKVWPALLLRLLPLCKQS